MSGTYFTNNVSIAYQSTLTMEQACKTLIKVSKNVHFLVKIHFGSSVSCKCNIYFGWSLEIQVVYIKRGCETLYHFKMLGMMFGDVMQILYI